MNPVRADGPNNVSPPPKGFSSNDNRKKGDYDVAAGALALVRFASSMVNVRL